MYNSFIIFSYLLDLILYKNCFSNTCILIVGCYVTLAGWMSFDTHCMHPVVEAYSLDHKCFACC